MTCKCYVIVYHCAFDVLQICILFIAHGPEYIQYAEWNFTQSVSYYELVTNKIAI